MANVKTKNLRWFLIWKQWKHTWFVLVSSGEDFDFNITKLIISFSITVIRRPTTDNGLPDKKYVADKIENGTVVRFNAMFENYKTVTVGDDAFILRKIFFYRYNN